MHLEVGNKKIETFDAIHIRLRPHTCPGALQGIQCRRHDLPADTSNAPSMRATTARWHLGICFFDAEVATKTASRGQQRTHGSFGAAPAPVYPLACLHYRLSHAYPSVLFYGAPHASQCPWAFTHILMACPKRSHQLSRGVNSKACYIFTQRSASHPGDSTILGLDSRSHACDTLNPTVTNPVHHSLYLFAPKRPIALLRA